MHHTHFIMSFLEILTVSEGINVDSYTVHNVYMKGVNPVNREKGKKSAVNFVYIKLSLLLEKVESF